MVSLNIEPPPPDDQRAPLPAFASEGVSIFDPAPRAALKKALGLAIAGQVLAIIMIVASINVLFGYSIDPNPLANSKLTVAVVNGDDPTGVVFQALQAVIADKGAIPLNYNFKYVSTSYNPATGDGLSGLSCTGLDIVTCLQNAVDKGTYTAALYVNPSASANLLAAVTNPISKGYNAASAFTYIFDEGRVGASYAVSVGSLGNSLALITSTYVKIGLATQFAAKGVNTNQVNIAVLETPVGVTTTNIHPAAYGLQVVLGTGILQVYLVALMNSLALAKIHLELEGRGIYRSHVVFFSLFHRLLSTFFLSLWPILVTLILNIADRSIVTAPVFFAWWMMTWLGMAVFQALCTWIMKLLGMAVGFLLLIILLMIQVAASAAVVPSGATPDFYQVGLGLPYTNLVQASKAIVIGSFGADLPRCIGAHFAWVGGFTLLILIEWRPWLHLYQDKGLTDAEARKVRRESMQTSYIEAGVVDEIPAATAEPEPGTSPDDMNVIDALVEPPLADVVSAADVSLFDPSMQPVRAGLRKKAIGLEIFLSLFAFVLLLITYGNSMRPSDYYANINVAVINGDVGSNTAIGAVFQQVQSAFQPPYGFTVSYLDPAAFSLSQAQNLVDSGRFWAVWYVNPGASAALAAALAAGSATPNAPAITFIYDSGRGVSFLMGLLKLWGSKFVATYNTVASTALLQTSAQMKAPFSTWTPSALMLPVTSVNNDLHVLKTYSGVDGAISGSGIALYLGMIVQVIIINAAHESLRDLGVRYDHRILAKAVHFFIGAMTLSFWPVISVVWFRVEISPSQFFAYWAFEGLGMAAFGCMTAMCYHFAGQALGPLLNLIMFSLNQASSSASLPFELQPAFFQIGYALPYNQIVTGTRYILYGSQMAGQFPRSVGVLCGWVGLMLIGSYRLFIRRRRLRLFTKAIRGEDDEGEGKRAEVEAATVPAYNIDGDVPLGGTAVRPVTLTPPHASTVTSTF